MRRWRLPLGTVTILFGVTGLLMQVAGGLRFPEQIAIALLVGLIAESVLGRLQTTLTARQAFVPSRLSYPRRSKVCTFLSDSSTPVSSGHPRSGVGRLYWRC
jgi:hypothetical protein